MDFAVLVICFILLDWEYFTSFFRRGRRYYYDDCDYDYIKEQAMSSLKEPVKKLQKELDRMIK